ncbi:MAG: DoxX family protein [bacterium]|nr:DoxX family protein [bacterium]
MVLLKQIGMYVMAAFYGFAGVMHFVNPEFFLKIVPPYLPFPLALVYLSGVAEIVLAIGLVIPRFRRLAAWGVILLLIAVFPANVYHYTSGGAGMDIPESMLIVRLLLQGVLIAWAYVYTRE